MESITTEINKNKVTCAETASAADPKVNDNKSKGAWSDGSFAAAHAALPGDRDSDTSSSSSKRSTQSWADKKKARDTKRVQEKKAGKQQKRDAAVSKSVQEDNSRLNGDVDYWKEKCSQIKQDNKEAAEEAAIEANLVRRRALSGSIAESFTGTKVYYPKPADFLDHYVYQPVIGKVMGWFGRRDQSLRLDWHDDDVATLDSCEEYTSIAGTTPARERILRTLDIWLPGTSGARTITVHGPILAELLLADNGLTSREAYESGVVRKMRQLPFTYLMSLDRPDLVRDTALVAMLLFDAKRGVLQDTWDEDFPVAHWMHTAIIYTVIGLMTLCSLLVVYGLLTLSLRSCLGAGVTLIVSLGQLLFRGICKELFVLSLTTIHGVWQRARSIVSGVLPRKWTQ